MKLSDTQEAVIQSVLNLCNTSVNLKVLSSQKFIDDISDVASMIDDIAMSVEDGEYK